MRLKHLANGGSLESDGSPQNAYRSSRKPSGSFRTRGRGRGFESATLDAMIERHYGALLDGSGAELAARIDAHDAARATANDTAPETFGP